MMADEPRAIGGFGKSLHFRAGIREIDNGIVVEIWDGQKNSENFFMWNRAMQIPLYVAECLSHMFQRHQELIKNNSEKSG